MFVGLDLENGSKSVTDVNGPCLLTRPLENLRPLRRKRFQVHPRAFVAAVLRPHDRKNAELGQVWLTPEKPDDRFIFIRRETMAFKNLLIDHQSHLEDSHARTGYPTAWSAGPFDSPNVPVFIADTADSKITRPSELPSVDSQARSGCGISPTMLRASFQKTENDDQRP